MCPERSKPETITLIELLAVIGLFVLMSELFMGLPSSLVYSYTSKQIKKSYLANISTQGLAQPANPKALRIRSGCLSRNPLWLNVSTASGTNYTYHFSKPSGAHWWSDRWTFQLIHVYPPVTNAPVVAHKKPLPPSVTITNAPMAASLSFTNLAPLDISLD
jgi:hypothetical protein